MEGAVYTILFIILLIFLLIVLIVNINVASKLRAGETVSATQIEWAYWLNWIALVIFIIIPIILFLVWMVASWPCHAAAHVKAC